MFVDGLAFERRLEIRDEDRSKALDHVLNEARSIELGEASAKAPGEIDLDQAAGHLSRKNAPFHFTFSARSRADVSTTAAQPANPILGIKRHVAIPVESNFHWPKGDFHPAPNAVVLPFKTFLNNPASDLLVRRLQAGEPITDEVAKA